MVQFLTQDFIREQVLVMGAAGVYVWPVFLFLIIESTRSLPQSAIRELTELESQSKPIVFSIPSNVAAVDLFAGDFTSKSCLEHVSQKSMGKYLDAIGKPPSGLAGGNLMWLGSYVVCQNISDAQYCLASKLDLEVTAKKSAPLTWGLCAPLACNATEIRQFITTISKVLIPNFKVKWGKDSSIHCAHRSEWTTGPIITLVICGIIAFLCLLGTLIDLCLIQQSWKFWLTSENIHAESYPPPQEKTALLGAEANGESTPLLRSNVSASHSVSAPNIRFTQPNRKLEGFLVQFLLCFSITRNTSKVMDCTVPPGAITSVNGVRVLSMWWVIMGHTFAGIVQLVNDPLFAFNILHRFTFDTVSSAFFSVDSFFVLSGLLVSYLSFRRMEKNDGRLPLFKFYFHRFWRLTPSYMFTILFYSNLYAFLGEGPMWFRNQNSTLCEKYWWTNLLYINNFYPTSLDDECLDWSWYLANDMQFYIISPLILFLVYRFKWKGLLVSVGGLLGISFIVTAVVIDHYDLSVVLFGMGGAVKKADPKDNFSDLLYTKPYCRIAPYLVGMVLGYLIHIEKSATRQSPLNRIPRQIVCLVGWFVATALGVTVVYGIYTTTKEGGKPFNKAENIAYGTFSRFAWGLALAWVIYACNKGYGSLVNKFLSASYWIPLSRLTYSAYLLHLLVLGTYFGSFQHTTEYTDTLFAFYYVSVIAMSYAAAFVLAVCVELPMIQLESVLFFKNN
ncbi:nose resistant to fluoxetine protein 6-like isoform X2 [Acropora palmata]|uniref:nose resistant to fluoxetine protein 6-like isoform X2 n=1 Tax=Acropora palmata TaxID=6131 RepID=UPI003DA03274